jgi:hypothetical protein
MLILSLCDVTVTLLASAGSDRVRHIIEEPSGLGAIWPWQVTGKDGTYAA